VTAPREAKPNLPFPLTVQGFGRRYSRVRPWAIRGASLAFPDGSITALVGPNGAGKSTLIRACLGFERPDEGRILVGGFDSQRHRREAVALVSYVPQMVALYRGLTIGDHLTMAALARASVFDQAYATSLIQRAELSVSLRADELSGGERVQVALALALAVKAPLMLLDEPQASLDPLARGEFFRTFLQEVRSREGTAVVSSHVVSDVEGVCDRLVVLGRGTVLLESSIADAKSRFRTVEAEQRSQQPIVGRFVRSTGQPAALVESQAEGMPATLEDVVLGHLAAARGLREEAA
jgi:ABC-2 type transport system ATP-binding protein